MKLTTTDFSKFYTIGTFRGIYGLGTNSKLSKYVVKLRNGVIEVHIGFQFSYLKETWFPVALKSRTISDTFWCSWPYTDFGIGRYISEK